MSTGKPVCVCVCPTLLYVGRLSLYALHTQSRLTRNAESEGAQAAVDLLDAYDLTREDWDSVNDVCQVRNRLPIASLNLFYYWTIDLLIADRLVFTLTAAAQGHGEPDRRHRQQGSLNRFVYLSFA